MVYNMAATNTIVDLSEDNDNAATPSGVGALPSSNPPDTFERSCDNPECSAPKLISQVPKRDTSEFITEPMVMNQPTLINGFTTVFQIDGVGTRMEDLMKESEAAENVGQNHKPKTVFRVVPNTHAHIVNYVVVDAAGETMRKIKANDPETIRKLLVSQRLSAEQMLKKLIGKALETPTRIENPLNAPVSLSGPAPVLAPAPLLDPAPMSASAPKLTPTSKLTSAPKLTPASRLTPAPVLSPASKLAPAPVCAPASALAPAPLSTSATISTSISTSALGTISSPAPKLATVIKPAAVLKPAPKPALTPKQPAPVPLLTSAAVSDPATVPSRNDVSTPKFPPGITIKLLSNSEAHKTPSPTAPTSSVVVSSPTNRQVSKPLSSLIQKGTSPPSQPTGAPQTTQSQTAAVGRVISASKPVVWQAVPPGFATKLTPIKITPPGTAPAVSPQSTNPVVVSPPKMTSSSLGISSASQQPDPKDSELLDLEKSIPATSLAVHRSQNESPSNQQPNILKRKIDSLTRVPEAIKRLRPRSPNRIKNASPLAGNLSQVKDSPPSTRKLPTLPKFQSKPISTRTGPTVQKILTAPKVPKVEEDAVAIPDAGTLPESSSNKKDIEDIEEENTSKPLRRKGRPLMGPASKMKALKAISDAKSQALQNDAPSQAKPPMKSETKPMIIGETVITRRGSLKASKESPQPAETLTKPCSVAITDIVKSSATTDSDSDSKSKQSNPNLTSSVEKEKSLPTETNDQPKASSSLIDKLRGRWTFKRQENDKPFLRSPRVTRSKVITRTSSRDTAAALDEIPDSTLLTSPSAPSRVLRVVLPSQKNAIVNNPSTSPHPNLKISSVISSGAALSESVPVTMDDDSSGPGIEQLQKELADLRRTVDRLTQGKKV